MASGELASWSPRGEGEDSNTKANRASCFFVFLCALCVKTTGERGCVCRFASRVRNGRVCRLASHVRIRLAKQCYAKSRACARNFRLLAFWASMNSTQRTQSSQRLFFVFFVFSVTFVLKTSPAPCASPARHSAAKSQKPKISCTRARFRIRLFRKLDSDMRRETTDAAISDARRETRDAFHVSRLPSLRLVSRLPSLVPPLTTDH